MEFLGEIGFKNKAYLSINFVITLICCCMVYLREKLKLELKKQRGIIGRSAKLSTSGRYRRIIKDCFVLSIHPYPWFLGKKFYMHNTLLDEEIFYYWNDLF